jgi:hypothetical protein
MKKTFLAAVLAVAFIGAQTQTVKAHDNTAAAVVGGIFAGAIIASALQPHSTVYYSEPAPVYYQPAPVYYSQPEYYYPPSACQPRPAYYEPARVVYAPPRPVVVYLEPSVNFRFGFGERFEHRHFCGHGW